MRRRRGCLYLRGALDPFTRCPSLTPLPHARVPTILATHIAPLRRSAALEMGLSPEQLLLLEEFADGLKGGRVEEERVVATMQRRVRF